MRKRGFLIRRSNVVAFLLSFVLFIGVCGFLDSRAAVARVRVALLTE
jgi:hypothetical protein